MRVNIHYCKVEIFEGQVLQVLGIVLKELLIVSSLKCVM